MKDLNECYKVLGLDKNSNISDVKKAYRVKAREAHPDVEGGSNEAFISVTEAYERIMSHEKNKKSYDSAESFSTNAKDTKSYTYTNNYDTFRQYSYYEEMGFGNAPQSHHDFYQEDVVPPPYNNLSKGEDVYLDLDISYEEQVGYKNIGSVRKRVSYTRKFRCNSCKGLGFNTFTCVQCGGKGSIDEISYSSKYGKATSSNRCGVCMGNGYIGMGSKCGYCKGIGSMESLFESEVYIDLISVMERGQRTLIYDGLGHEVVEPKEWGINGSLIINLNLLKKVHDNIHKVYINFIQAIEGCNIRLELDEGKFVPTITIPPGIKSGTKLKMDKGDNQYLIEVLITVPKLEDLNKKATRLFTQLKEVI